MEMNEMTGVKHFAYIEGEHPDVDKHSPLGIPGMTVTEEQEHKVDGKTVKVLVDVGIFALVPFECPAGSDEHGRPWVECLSASPNYIECPGGELPDKWRDERMAKKKAIDEYTLSMKGKPMTEKLAKPFKWPPTPKPTTLKKGGDGK